MEKEKNLRLFSGVGIISREIVTKTAHKYNWVCVAAAINHPEAGKIIDLSEAISKEYNIKDASVKLYPYNGYGDQALVRYLMNAEKPDAILHFTDPRQWLWLYHMENEIRQKIPLMFYHVWDNLPYPTYNESYYRSCDWIACISKQTYNIVKQVTKEDAFEPWQISYIPHGVDSEIFHKITDSNEQIELMKFRSQIIKNDEVNFVLLYNSRNISRKMLPNIIVAYDKFLKRLPELDRKKCRLLLHTQPMDDNGTDLPAVIRNLTPDADIIFSSNHVDAAHLNYLYNIADATINNSSAEGFGISTLESLMAETPIIVNVTGGLQDQCGFEDEDQNCLDPDIHFDYDWGTNEDGRYKNCGEWAIPIFPNNRSIIGSIPTPFICDARTSIEDVTNAIHEMYKKSSDQRSIDGKKGREFALSEGRMSADFMARSFMEGIDRTLEKWTPRSRFDLYKA